MLAIQKSIFKLEVKDYTRQLEGKTTRQLVLEHAKIEGIAETSAWSDWSRVKQWNNEDWEKIEKICFKTSSNESEII